MALQIVTFLSRCLNTSFTENDVSFAPHLPSQIFYGFQLKVTDIMFRFYFRHFIGTFPHLNLPKLYMGTIITVTFNPALDKSTSVKELVAERKLSCSAPVYEPGGGGINVARAIRKLGGDAVAYYLAGGDAGNRINALLADELVETVVTKISGFTRENLLVFDNSRYMQYLFDMPGPVIMEKEYDALLKSIEDAQDIRFIVASGSLPAGIPPDIFARLALIAKRKQARLVVDTSGEPLKHALKNGVYLIKPNLKELAFLTGAGELTDEQVPAAAKAIIKQGGCEAVVVSQGALGATLVTGTEVLKITPPQLDVKSTVGAGDSLVAGIIISLAGNQSLAEAVQYGVACGSAATLNAGTELCRKADAERLFRVIKNEILVVS
jgi:6-phosphofructokinase 2